MTDHPTVMNPAEIDAWRRGDKTQHRVPLDRPPAIQPKDAGKAAPADRILYMSDGSGPWFNPFAPGDRLYLQEAFSTGNYNLKQARRRTRTHGKQVVYEDERPQMQQYKNLPWHPAEDMPEWASRYRIPITAIKGIERVQNISEDDARAEGMKPAAAPLGTLLTYRMGFIYRWNERHGSDAWERNDVVAVLELGRE